MPSIENDERNITFDIKHLISERIIDPHHDIQIVSIKLHSRSHNAGLKQKV